MATGAGGGSWHIPTWYEENKELFAPPVCNKIMHKNQLTVMFVGGPNTRADFHIDQGSEFFFQMRGNIELPTIQRGVRKVVKIKEGHVFLLPSRIPHSPQRPEEGSFGLVMERRRQPGEFDGLRYYIDSKKCDEILWERYFHCEDLDQDLLPVIMDFRASEENRTGLPTGKNISASPETPIDIVTEVPAPFHLQSWLDAHQEQIDAGHELSLFGDHHPDKEFRVLVAGGAAEPADRQWRHETWLYQVKGRATVSMRGRNGAVQPTQIIPEGGCCIVPANTKYSVAREEGAIGLMVTNDPLGNKTGAKL